MSCKFVPKVIYRASDKRQIHEITREQEVLVEMAYIYICIFIVFNIFSILYEIFKKRLKRL